jgi:WD40 repeat protein
MNQLAPTGVAVDPRGRFVIASRSPGGVTIGPLDGSPPSRLEGLNPGAITFPVAIHPERNLVAAGVLVGSTEHKVIGVWDLRDESVRVLGPADDAGEGFWGGYWTLTFLRDGSLLSQTREGVVRRWTMDDGSSEVVAEGRCAIFGVRPDGHTAVIACVYADGGGELLSIDFATGERRALPAFRPHDSEPSGVALSTSGDLFAVGYMDGTIQLGTTAGGEPWHLLGHTSAVFGLAFSPDDRLLATAGQDGSVRIWPVPDLSKPPIQALPYQELLAALDSFTNLRAVRDEGSSSGWRVQLGPFPGWETAPAW